MCVCVTYIHLLGDKSRSVHLFELLRNHTLECIAVLL